MTTDASERFCDQWAGVVFDLDGTLVRLRVEWAALEDRIAAELQMAGIETEGRSVWSMLETARERDRLDLVEPMINDYEIEGAERSKRLALADVVSTLPCPVGICSLNCEAACRRALDVHGLSKHVETIVGRDSIRPWKPDPAPLEAAIEGIGVRPEAAVFVGDSERDAHTAEAAGVAFLTAEAAIETLDA